MKNVRFFILVFALLSSLTSCSKSDDVGGTEPEKVVVSVSPQTLSFEEAGGQQTVTVTSSREWSAYADCNWLTLSMASGLSGSAQMTVTAAENSVYDTPRTATITVKSGAERFTVNVSQKAPAKPAPSPIKCTVEGYDNLVWSDEFDEGTTLNTSKWTHEVQKSGWVNNELQNYVNGVSPSGKRVTEIADGILKINCFKDKDGKVYSGRVYGNKSKGFTYGVFEARIKLPKGKGTWPAWWMMPVTFTSWPHCGEIDIMEEVGANPNFVSSSIHCTDYNHVKGTQKTHEMKCDGAEDDFHVYTLEWTADYIQTYVDGKKQLYFANDKKGNDNSWPFHVAFYPILNLAWGGDWGGYKGIDESALPATMEVDWVRVYQK